MVSKDETNSTINEEVKNEIFKNDNERWEVNHKGELCIEIPADTRKVDNKSMLEKMLSKNEWNCTIEENSGCYYKIKIENNKINVSKTLNIYFANIRKEDPDRNREEKKIQLGGKDPRNNMDNSTIILGIYVYNENDDIDESIIVAWPVEDKNYDKNPSLRVNMKQHIQKAKVNGLYIDTGEKRLVAFRPEFIFYYIENFDRLHNNYTQPRPRTNNIVKKTQNRIIFGAPGTGKSYTIDEDKKDVFNEGNCERVTFHPNYSYAQFVGAYKPIAKEKGKTKKEEFVSYEFVPGPFTRVLINSLNDENTPNLLIIEEINRANPAGVFGDVFQLLDRDSNGKSKYTINISEEMGNYICGKLKKQGTIDYIKKYGLYIPENMYIWTTMNSADQGVFPMDAAFKRRWSFEYLDIDAGEESLKSKVYNKIKLKNGTGYSEYDWNKIRKEINSILINSTARINEDKLLGPFFLSETELSLSQTKETQEGFDNVFKSKLLMYLYEDVLKHKRTDILFLDSISSLSDLAKAYDSGNIFNFDINKFKYMNKEVSEANEEEQLGQNNSENNSADSDEN